VINLPKRIDSDLDAEIRRNYSQKCHELTQEDVNQFSGKLLRRIRMLEKSNQDLMQDLGIAAKVFYSVLLLDKKFDLADMDDHHRKLAAALSYFLDPMGVIPDHSISDGFLDDAILFNHCVRSLKKNSRDRVLEYFSIAKMKHLD
jgi:uncharacterized membrane protein YkvA (DUF1232 family)